MFRTKIPFYSIPIISKTHQIFLISYSTLAYTTVLKLKLKEQNVKETVVYVYSYFLIIVNKIGNGYCLWELVGLLRLTISHQLPAQAETVPITV